MEMSGHEPAGSCFLGRAIHFLIGISGGRGDVTALRTAY